MVRISSLSSVALVLLLVIAGGARAAVPDPEALEVSGALNSTNSKSLNVSCPAGKQLTGTAAGKTLGAEGQVRMLAMRPDAALRTASASFREDETGFAGDWQITAYALCSQPLVGMVRVGATSPSSSASKNIAAKCPTGRRLVGLGGETAGGAGQVVIDVIRPDNALTTATVVAREDQNGFAGNWTVSAYAICAVPPQGLVRASGASSSADTFHDAGVTCPNGKNLLAMGGEVSGQSGQLSLETFVFPDGVAPKGGFARALQDEDGFNKSYTVTAYAICANGAVRRTFVGFRSTGASITVGTGCESESVGHRVTGFGGEVTGGVGQVPLTEFSPFPPPEEGVTAKGEVDGTGFSGTYSVTAHAICATPLPGHLPFSPSSDTDSSTTKSLHVECLSPAKLVGAGGAVNDGQGQVILDQVVPDANLGGAVVSAQEDQDFFSGNWSLTGSTVCVNPPPGLQRVRVDTDFDSEEIQRATASCPAGKHLLGTGATVTSGAGEVMLKEVRPDKALKSVTVTSVEDEDGYDGVHQTSAFAICVNI